MVVRSSHREFAYNQTYIVSYESSFHELDIFASNLYWRPKNDRQDSC